MAKGKRTRKGKGKKGGLTLAELFGQNRADFPLKQAEYVRPVEPPPKYVPPPPPPPPEPEVPGTTTSTPPSEPEELEVPRPPPPKKLPKKEVNPLWLPQKSYGTQSDSDIKFYGVQRHTTKAKGKGRKTRRRKHSRRRR